MNSGGIFNALKAQAVHVQFGHESSCRDWGEMQCSKSSLAQRLWFGGFSWQVFGEDLVGQSRYEIQLA